jgi:hypothetical protein
VRLAFLDFGEAGRFMVGEIGDGEAVGRLGVGDLTGSSAALDCRGCVGLSSLAGIRFWQKYDWVCFGSIGEIGLNASSYPGKSSSRSGEVKLVDTEASVSLDWVVDTVAVEAAEFSSEISLACGRFEVSTTRSSFSPRPRIP